MNGNWQFFWTLPWPTPPAPTTAPINLGGRILTSSPGTPTRRGTDSGPQEQP